MSSRNLGQMRDEVYALGTQYAPQLKAPPQMVDQAIEYAQRFAYRKHILANKDAAALPLSFTDGDNLPVDFFGFAYRAYTGSPRVAFTWIPVEDLATLKTNPFNKATAARPIIWFENQVINTFPAGMSGTLYEFKRPPKLFGQGDSTDLGLPDNLYPFVNRLALLRVLQFFVSRAKGYGISEAVRKESMESSDFYNKSLYAAQTKDSRSQA